VQFVQPTQIYVDVEELHQQGATLTHMSRFVLTLTKREVGRTRGRSPPTRSTIPAFLAAFPSAWLDQLACVPRG
jgi:hypothetical protein